MPLHLWLQTTINQGFKLRYWTFFYHKGLPSNKLSFCKLNGEKSSRFTLTACNSRTPCGIKSCSTSFKSPNWGLFGARSAAPLHLMEFCMENRVCVFCFFKHCTIVNSARTCGHSMVGPSCLNNLYKNHQRRMTKKGLVLKKKKQCLEAKCRVYYPSKLMHYLLFARLDGINNSNNNNGY